MKNHWLIRSTGWTGVVIMSLSAPAIFLESLSCRETPPWELCSFAALIIGAVISLIPQAWLALNVILSSAKYLVMRMKKEAWSYQALSDLNVRLAKDSKTYEHVARTIMLLYATGAVVLLSISYCSCGHDYVFAQTLWRCGGVPVIYTIGITSVVLWFLTAVLPSVRWVNGMFVRMIERL